VLARTPAQLVAAAVDPNAVAHTEACGPPGKRRWLCELVWEHSSSYDLARLAHYLSPWVTSLLIVIGAVIVNRIMRLVVHRTTRRLIALRPGSDPVRRARRADTIGAALRSLVTIVIIIITLFAVISAFGVNITPLLAGAGLAGVALGFGAQNLLRDVIAGSFMIFEDQLNVGDRIDTGLVTGTVENVTLRVTMIRDDEGVAWYVPNGAVTRIANLSQRVS
jgi:small conductance mechanosensitive channel